MDPLSVTLAVISLAAASQSILKFGKKLHESFSNAPKSLRVAQGLAREIEGMLDDLAEFCDHNRDVLEGSMDFRTALQDLIVKLETFEQRVLSLLFNQEIGRRRSLLIRGWDTWRKSDTIERSTRELKHDVKQVVRRFMIMGGLRTEANTERVYHATIQSLKIIGDVERKISDMQISTTSTSRDALTSPTMSIISTDWLEQSIAMLAHTTSSISTPMLRSPAVINDEVISTSYIKFQVNKIAAMLEAVSQSLAALHTSGSQAIHNHESSLALVLPEHSMAITHLRRQTVRQVTHIFDLLETKLTNTSLSEGVQALSQLSFLLGSLKMDDDAVSISYWVVRLSRALLGYTDHLETATDLARNLLNYSIDLQAVGDDNGSLAAIEEAYAITQTQVQNVHDTPTQVLLLHSLVLDHYALTLSHVQSDAQKAMELVKESVCITEIVLEASTGLHLHTAIGTFDPDFLGRLNDVASLKSQIVKYAQARSLLASFLAADGHPQEALASMRLGLALYRGVSALDTEINPQLANSLYRTLIGDIGETLPGEERLDYANECIDLYRNLAHKNPTYYARRLVNVLWAKADFLRTMERHNESLEAWKEVVNLAEQLEQDAALHAEALNNMSQQLRILSRYEDAASTRMLAITTSQGAAMDIQADRYFSLYGDLQLAGRYGEATQATQTSLALYRMLAVKDPNKWAEDVGIGLSALAESLVLIGDYDNALSAGRESVQIFSNLLQMHHHPWPFGGLLNALRIMHNVAFLLDDARRTIGISSEVISHYTTLVEAFPQAEHVAEDMLYYQHCYGVHLYQLGQLVESQRYFEQLLRTWMTTPSNVSDAYMTDRRLIALTVYAEVLDSMGHTSHGMAALLRAVEAVTPYPDSEAVVRNLHSIRLRTLLMVDLGQEDEALQVAEEMLRLAREVVDVHREELVGSLHAVAVAATFHRSYGRVVEVAKEALATCQNDESRRPLTKLPRSPLCERVTNLARSLKFLSFGTANLRQIEDGLQYARQAVAHALKLRTLPNLASSVAAGLYMETRGNLASILVASGGLSEALEIFEERRGYFSKRVVSRHGEYRDLLPTLYVLGTLYCNDGRHDDGLAVAEDLRQVMISLKVAIPALHDQIILRVQHDLGTPILQGVNTIRGRLECTHQSHATALLCTKV